MPIPGWQLPGVMSAGAAQILLKSAAMVPDRSVVLAGNGPLMLLLAWQYLQAGVSIDAILDTTQSANRFKALRYLPRALAASDYLWKGLRLILSIRRARIPWFKGVTELEAMGDGCLQAVSFRVAGRQHRIDSGLLLLHQGLIPGLHNLQLAECKIVWSEAQQSWQAAIDRWGETSTPGIYVAGDGAGIGGARASHLSGQLAGLQVAHRLGLLATVDRDQLAANIFSARNRHLAIRPWLDAYYRIAGDIADETMVCRCEEVSARSIRDVVRLGASGPNQVKAFTRCGMGPCQGRFCGSSLEQIIARQCALAPDVVGRLSTRPPLKPINLGQLAATSRPEKETDDVG